MLDDGDMEDTVGKVQVGSPDGTTMPNALEYEAEASALAIASAVCRRETAG